MIKNPNDLHTQGRSSLLRAKENQYELQMKKKFIEVMNSDMSYSDCLDHIQSEITQSKKMASFSYKILCFKDDGIYQLNQAITKVFGSVTSKEDDSPSGNKTVEFVDITLADGTRCKAPFGNIDLPGLGEDAGISINYSTSRHMLIIQGKCQKRFSPIIDDIVEETKKNLANNSIYKGQAIAISDINNPTIINLSGIEEQLMVLSDKTKYDLRPIEARLLNPQQCLEKGIPLKFGALLSGGYGTGKTLLAFKLAKMAINNGWVFIYLKDPKLLAESLRMAKVIDRSGWGVLVFTEDIDQVTRGNRDASMQDILNTLDGGDTKDMNVISLFTTNHIELIEPTFLRGKRIGTIISMGALDAKTAEEFIRASFSVGCYTIDDDLTEVCEFIAKNKIVPAFMAEIVEKVKSMMIFNEDECAVKAKDIRYCVESYLEQVALSRTKDMSVTPEKQFVDAFAEVLGQHKLLKGVNATVGMLSDNYGCDVQAFSDRNCLGE